MTADFREPVHGRTEIEFPQLEMIRDNLEGIPEMQLPPGYTIRTFQPGDEHAWASIMIEAFNPFWNLDRFNKFVRPHFAFRPERLLFLCQDGDPVGSAMAFNWPGIPRETGFIYMVAVKKDCCGRGLGRPLTAACLHRFLGEGTFNNAILHTESYRLPAIKHYLRLGFRPRLLVERHRDMWKMIFHRLAMSELIDKFDIENAPILPGWRMHMRTWSVVSYNYWLSFRSLFSF